MDAAWRLAIARRRLCWEVQDKSTAKTTETGKEDCFILFLLCSDSKFDRDQGQTPTLATGIQRKPSAWAKWQREWQASDQAWNLVVGCCKHPHDSCDRQWNQSLFLVLWVSPHTQQQNVETNLLRKTLWHTVLQGHIRPLHAFTIMTAYYALARNSVNMGNTWKNDPT